MQHYSMKNRKLGTIEVHRKSDDTAYIMIGIGNCSIADFVDQQPNSIFAILVYAYQFNIKN